VRVWEMSVFAHRQLWWEMSPSDIAELEGEYTCIPRSSRPPEGWRVCMWC